MNTGGASFMTWCRAMYSMNCVVSLPCVGTHTRQIRLWPEPSSSLEQVSRLTCVFAKSLRSLVTFMP